MFDSFSNRVGASQAGRFAETFDIGNPMNGADNGGVVVNEGGGGSSSFGGIASYQVCACCARFHGATSDGGDPLNVILNSDDRGGVSPNDKPSLLPGDAGTQITRSNTSWATGLGQAAVVTFAFRLSAPTTMPSDTATFSQFGAQQITATLQSLAAWSDVANITFTRVADAGSEYSNNATILFGNYATGQNGAAAFAYLPGGMPGATGAGQVQGDVWVHSDPTNTAPLLYSYGTQTLLHEIGHAIGLSHPADYNASEGTTITYGAHATYFEDSRQYTVMSYFSETLTGANFGGGRYASSPLMDDIAAAQRLYGANTTTRTGDTTYGFNSNAGLPWFAPSAGNNNTMIFCVWDAGGTDTFDFSGYSQAQVIDLRQGAFSNVGGLTGNVSIAIGAVIENAIGGTGADTIRGNSGANIIRGGGGADVIDGGLGSDTVVFSGARSAYTITWNGQIGTVSATGQAPVTITNVEFLQFSDQTIAAAPTGGITVGGDLTNETINGAGLADTLGGLGGNDTINGLDGDDYLDGGSGVDILNGGDGNDTVIGGLGNDTLNGGAGTDTADYSGAATAVTVDLAQGLAGGGGGSDTLTSIENVTGTALADTITGDSANNVIRGGGGVDTLTGGGGDDQLFAGAPGQSGGAPDVLKGAATANGTRATAVSLTGTFDLMAKPGVVNATTTPHSTVIATTHGGVEYYSFTVSQPNTAVIFDIDGATFDTTLRLFDSDGLELTSNDDGSGDPEGGPSGDTTDSRLTFNFAVPGTYYIQVAEWVSNPPGGSFTSGAPPAGQNYTLHVSLAGQSVQPITQSGSTLNGDAGADLLTGGVGKDTLNGGADNDTLNGGGEDDTLNGGDGTDTAVYSGLRSAYTITTSSGVTTITGPDGTDTVTNVERLQFSNGLFDIAGNPIEGTTPIEGTPNPDTLNGTTNADTINGLAGDDTISGLAGNDTINGGDGLDTAVFSGTMAQSTVATNAGTTTVTGPDGTDTLTNVEYLRFSDGTLIVGAGGGQLFTGTANADTLNGTAFNDQINAGAGVDTITGGLGNDTINGGDGLDTAVFNGTMAQSTIATNAGTTTVTGANGTDTLTNVEYLRFSDGTLIVGAGGGQLFTGTANADTVNGTAFNDQINAGSGNDTVNAGAGADAIDGGDGADTAVFAGARASYQLNTSGGVTTVTGPDGTDTLTNVERLLFADGYFDLAGNPVDNAIVGTANGEALTGTAFRDVIDGLGGADVITGGAGNDGINGGEGRDKLYGEDGDDTIRGGADGDQMYGGAGVDTLYGDDSDDYLSGGDGDDYIEGGEGADEIHGETGRDRIIGGLGRDRIYGEDGNDVLNGGDDGDIMIGGAGGDTIRGDAGDDYVNGAADDDFIEGGDGADVLVGEDGADRLLGGDGNDNLQGGAGANRLEGGAGGDILYGGVDGDVLLGGLDDDYVAAGAGDDYINGESGIDYLHGQDGADNILGSDGNDYLFGEGGRDRLDGGDGNDTIYGGDDGDILVGGAGNDTLIGELGDDYVDAGEGDNYAAGGDGIDVLVGGAGADQFLGGAGDDTLRGGDGANRLEGGAGADVLYGGVNADILLGQDGDDYAVGGAGGDTIYGDAGIDVLLGQDGDDVIRGGDGNDVLYGHAGSDRLEGGEGADRLDGGDGADVLLGGIGNDAMLGGTGDDTFIVKVGEGFDSIQDFAAGAASGDTIQLIGTGWSSFADVLANSVQSGSNVVINIGGGETLTLMGVTRGNLTAGDFTLFAAAPAPAEEKAVNGGALVQILADVEDDFLVLPGGQAVSKVAFDQAQVLPGQEPEPLVQLPAVDGQERQGRFGPMTGSDMLTLGQDDFGRSALHAGAFLSQDDDFLVLPAPPVGTEKNAFDQALVLPGADSDQAQSSAFDAGIWDTSPVLEDAIPAHTGVGSHAQHLDILS